MDEFEKTLNIYWSIKDHQEKTNYLNQKHIDLKNLYSSIPKMTPETFNDLKIVIKRKIDLEYSKEELIDWYGFPSHQEAIKLILNDFFKDETIDDYESVNSICLTDEFLKENEKFEWRPNQLEGIKNAIKNFASGIHIGATGSGKSLMFLNIINHFPEGNILITCERKNILKQLFDKEDTEETNKYLQFLKEKNIIDVDKFEILDLYTEGYRRRNTFNKLLEHQKEKPYLILANRSYLTGNLNGEKRYLQIHPTNIPKFIVLDEMHSASSNKNYQMLVHFKLLGTKIQGFSATPFRYGESKHISFNFSNEEDNKRYNTPKHLERLLNIFHQEDNEEKFNIISDFDIKKAIETGVILEPCYHLVKIPREKFNENNDYNESELRVILNRLNVVIGIVPYSKIIIWCQETEKANKYLLMIDELKLEFKNLENLQLFLDHSKVSKDFSERKNDYQNFYNMQDNACLICANKHREGSDIPYLSVGILLDKVKNRGVIPAVQSYGRVLRKDKEGLKEKGHIIEVLIETDEDEYIIGLYRRLISYFQEFFNFDDKISSVSNFKKKISRKNGKIRIELGNGKFIEINDVNITEVSWKNILDKCTHHLEENLEFNEFDKFQLYKEDIKKYGFTSTKQYREVCLKFDLEPNPEEKFGLYWKGWYDFLSLTFPKMTFDEWKVKIKELGIKNSYDYLNSDLPFNPEEVYEEVNCLLTELNKIWEVEVKYRRCK